MKLARRASTLLLVCGLGLFANCDEDPIHPAAGVIAVSVMDGGSPVSGVEIRIAPRGLTATTDSQGVAQFEVAPGDYFVDAKLCCIGASLIEYHVPVTVASGESEAVELRACLVCV
jgi:hypothetical protein